MDVAWEADIEGLCGSMYGAVYGCGCVSVGCGCGSEFVGAAGVGATEIDEAVDDSDIDEIADKLEADGRKELAEELDTT